MESGDGAWVEAAAVPRIFAPPTHHSPKIILHILLWDRMKQNPALSRGIKKTNKCQIRYASNRVFHKRHMQYSPPS